MPLATVVLDTNVFVAAGFNPRSASARIVEAVKQGQMRMVSNDATGRELEHILQKIPPPRAHPVSELFRPGDRFTAATHPEPFAFIPDPDDRKFAALARAAGARKGDACGLWRHQLAAPGNRDTAARSDWLI